MSQDRYSRNEVILTIAWAIIVCLFLAGITDIWHSKIRYSIQYGVDYNQVTKEEKPHDCDWFKVPIGNKGCHYDIQVSTLLTRVDDSDPKIKYVSIDAGKTWSVDDAVPPTNAQVNISWKKK